MKKKSLLLSMSIVLLLSGCGSSVSQEDYDAKVMSLKNFEKNYDEKVQELESAQKEISELQEKLESAQANEAETDNNVQDVTETDIIESESSVTNEIPEHRTGDEIIGISDKILMIFSLLPFKRYVMIPQVIGE